MKKSSILTIIIIIAVIIFAYFLINKPNPETPEEVANSEKSYTGQYLKNALTQYRAYQKFFHSNIL